MSAVKRCEKLLALVEKRATGKLELVNANGGDKQRLSALVKEDKEGVGKEEVIYKASGKAIAKVLDLAVYWQARENVRVTLRTGSQGVVDDIVEVEDADKASGAQGETGEEEHDVDMENGQDEVEEEDLPETQIRRVSFLEVAITWR